MTSSPIRIVDTRAAGDFASFAELVPGPVIVSVDEVAEILATAAATVGRYGTYGGSHVTVVVTEPHAETSAPGWIATCSGCGWTDDQYACWHELWPAYPSIAAGDVRALLLDQAEEHADFCETGAAR